MLKKAFCLLLLCFIFLVGCDAKLDIEIKDNDVITESSFIIDKSMVKDSIYYTVDNIAGKYFPSADFLIGEDTKEYYDGNKAIYQKTEKFSLGTFNNSNIFSFCYDAHNVIVEDDYIQISTNNKFKCYDYYSELESFDIVLKTNHKLIESNADEVNGYIYKWHITKDNANDKAIYIKLYRDKFVFNYENEFLKTALIIAGIVLIIGIIVFIIIRKVKKAGNV